MLFPLLVEVANSTVENSSYPGLHLIMPMLLLITGVVCGIYFFIKLVNGIFAGYIENGR